MKRLLAIEIAEGALLADFAVIFHLISVYLPIGGSFFRLLIPVVFAVLVLRRSLYVGIMGLCVAFFIASVTTGLVVSIPILFESGAGLFLGLTMKYRLHHLLILLLGVTSGAMTLFALLLLATWLLGLPFSDIVLSLHKSYEVLMSTLSVVAAKAGVGDWWKQSASPSIASIAQFAFTYWLAVFFTALWVYLWPVVFVFYFVTNPFVRLLGYDVRPFPGDRVEKFLHRSAKSFVRQGLKRGLIRRRQG